MQTVQFCFESLTKQFLEWYIIMVMASDAELKSILIVTFFSFYNLLASVFFYSDILCMNIFTLIKYY